MENNFDIRDQIKAIIDDRALKQSLVAKRVDMQPCQLCATLKMRRKLEAMEFIRLCYAMDMSCDDVINYIPNAKWRNKQ